ncbi:hypothetical protein Poli38472_012931 [Pythium oligandrum]|uniref:Uncharacterized protein n=1 Tax=Pythium oligandrum TaxID=41045 RepID=A0A8K1CJP5_PYTOL|nr:hypothetical protein Poli38472_012931 [Pythium oligandrum]|eukprot:TMW64309.1 hypothetical protein Poli38472_012931 [Pythium oligandrum]
MGRRRSKWKDKANGADRGVQLLQLARSGACEELDALLASEWPELATQTPAEDTSARMDAIKERTDFLQLTQDHNGSTALHLAASEGHCAMVQKLLALGAGEIHLSGGRKRYARTPLHEAAITGRLEACRLLVDYGFLVDCHTTRGRTPLMYATKGNHLDVVTYLVDECHASINEQNEMGMTPLYVACQDGHEDIARFLISRGADLDRSNRTKHAPIHEAVAGGFLSIVSLLLDSGAEKHVVDAMGVTIWHEAAGNGSVDMLELLVKYDVSLQPHGHIQVDKVMARHPFHYAAVEGKPAFIQAMLAKNLVDVNFVDADNCSAIYYAAANGHADVLKVLLANGGDPNLSSIRRSPLHCAVEWRRIACIQLLLAHGASRDARDKEARTPQEIAQARGDSDVLACFNGAAH